LSSFFGFLCFFLLELQKMTMSWETCHCLVQLIKITRRQRVVVLCNVRKKTKEKDEVCSSLSFALVS